MALASHRTPTDYYETEDDFGDILPNPSFSVSDTLIYQKSSISFLGALALFKRRRD